MAAAPAGGAVGALVVALALFHGTAGQIVGDLIGTSLVLCLGLGLILWRRETGVRAAVPDGQQT